MRLFGKGIGERRKSAKAVGAGAESTGGAVTHRFTLDLSRAHGLAVMLASSRASEFIEIPDLLAGMYIYEWDRLSEYWPEENRDDIEGLLRDMCRISPQRWNHWIRFYDAQKKKSEPRSQWQRLTALRKKSEEVNAPRHSAALRLLFDVAGLISPFRDKVDGRDIPILTIESVLLCIAQTPGSEIAKKLRETGLDVARVEKAALSRKRSPLR